MTETKKKEAAEKTALAKAKFVSTEDLAKFVGVESRRIQQLTKEGVIKKEPGGKYDFKGSVYSLLQFYRQKADSRISGDSDEMKNVKERQAMAKAKLEELKVAQLEGTLHKAEDIERVIGAGLSRLRINLLAIPLGVAPLIKDRDNVNEIAEIINERICRALYEVATIDIKKMMAEEEGADSE